MCLVYYIRIYIDIVYCDVGEIRFEERKIIFEYELENNKNRVSSDSKTPLFHTYHALLIIVHVLLLRIHRRDGLARAHNNIVICICYTVRIISWMIVRFFVVFGFLRAERKRRSEQRSLLFISIRRGSRRKMTFRYAHGQSFINQSNRIAVYQTHAHSRL